MPGASPKAWTLLSAIALLLISPLVRADSNCRLGKVADLPVTMDGLRPNIEVKFNGQPAKLTLDSGAFFSTITDDAAAQLGLRVSPAPFGFYIQGVGGNVDVGIAKVKTFTIAGVDVSNVEFLVGGSSIGSPGLVSTAGLMGQNLLEIYDVEYDLATGMIRLFKTQGSCGKAMLAYWVKPGQSFSMMPIEGTDPRNPHTIGVGMLNGKKIRVAFDTGAFYSLLSLKAAQRAGISPDSPGVTDGGLASGIGKSAYKSYIGTFDSFGIGDGEEIRHAKLRFADTDLGFADMLLGADFFISHHVFVATREHRLFLTYDGGPVFNIPTSHAVSDTHQDAPAPVGNPPPAGDAVQDVAELARLGAALIARRDFKAGISALDKAVEQKPEDPEYRYQRADAYRQSGQNAKALADYDRVIALREDFLPAYIPRAQIKLKDKDRDGALKDLDTAARLAPTSADLRFMLAKMYESVDRIPSAVEQMTLWIDSHEVDSRMGEARLLRCWSKMLENQGLPQALDDCNFALRHAVNDDMRRARIWSVRGLVHLRLGDYNKAAADFDDALKREPRDARALYGRGLVEAKKRQRAASDADLSAAKAADAELVTRIEQYGVRPLDSAP